MTYGAIGGLILFAVVAATNFSWERVWPADNLLRGKGWKAVLDAVPYALWWLVMIETVALAAEEAHDPHRTIPRGLTWAQVTLVGLVVLTWLFACGALDSQKIAVNEEKEDISYPLAEVIRRIPAGESALLVQGFGVIALFGLIASYHGMIYGTSRQLFALGRAGYLPAFLGEVHVCSLIAAGFVIAYAWFKEGIEVAVLVSTLTALIWYILAMACLWILRRREPALFATYQAPLYRLLPILVILLSVFAIYFYGGLANSDKVIGLTVVFYALGLGYYLFWSRKKIQHAAPEELAARQGRAAPQELLP
jgi:ethanolamine permease